MIHKIYKTNTKTLYKLETLEFLDSFSQKDSDDN